MDDCELDILVKELEADHTDILKYVDRELEKKTSTIGVDEYDRLAKIGQGTFGEVFKVKHNVTKNHYALKRLKTENEMEGFPITALREIRILSLLNHENIVRLRGICHKKSNASSSYRYDFFLLFDFCDHDLAGLLSHKAEFTLPMRKSIMKQLLTGLFFLHKNNVLHRDLKASNILIDRTGILKIADFGLARLTVAPTRSDRPTRYTGRVVTLWYRPPEILLNDRYYGKPVDLWGAGCIMAELWTRYPIMQGECEVSQLNLIIQLCGSITPEVWPAVERLEAFERIRLPRDVRRHVKEKLLGQIACHSAVDLIDRLLQLDPARRPDADAALAHDFFHEEPPPGELGCLSRSGSSYLEYLGQASRSRHHHHHQHAGAQQQQNAAAALAGGFRGGNGSGVAGARRPPVAIGGALPGQAGPPIGAGAQAGLARHHHQYRGMPEPDTSSINDRVF